MLCATYALFDIFPIFLVIIASPVMYLLNKKSYVCQSPIVMKQFYFLCRTSTGDVYSCVTSEFWQKVTGDGAGLIYIDYYKV